MQQFTFFIPINAYKRKLSSTISIAMFHVEISLQIQVDERASGQQSPMSNICN